MNGSRGEASFSSHELDTLQNSHRTLQEPPSRALTENPYRRLCGAFMEPLEILKAIRKLAGDLSPNLSAELRLGVE